MPRLIVELPPQRDFVGHLWLEQDDGGLIAGPFDVCGRADAAAADANGNPTRNPLLQFGDTPLGHYRVVSVVTKATGGLADRLGRHGVIVLAPAGGDAALADANGRFQLLIHGDGRKSGRQLRPTNGSLRLRNDDQKRLVEALTRLSNISCDCRAMPAGRSRRSVAIDVACNDGDPFIVGVERRALPMGSWRPFVPAAVTFAAAQAGSGGQGGTGGGDGYGAGDGDDSDVNACQNSDTDLTFPAEIPPQCTNVLDLDATRPATPGATSPFQYVSQQPGGPNYAAGANCKTCSDQMVESTGVAAVVGAGSDLASWRQNLFLIAQTATASGGLKDPDPQVARAGLQYLDQQLSEGHAVEVGVSYDPNKQQADGRIAGHYVVVYGKKQEGDQTYYAFRDPGTSNPKRSYGVFQVTNNLLVGQAPYKACTYSVSEIRKNVMKSN